MSLEGDALSKPSPLQMGKDGRVDVRYQVYDGKTQQGHSIRVQAYSGRLGQFMKWLGTAEYAGKGQNANGKSVDIYLNKRSLGKRILKESGMEPEKITKQAKDKAIEILFPNSAPESKEFAERKSWKDVEDLFEEGVYVPSEFFSDVEQELALEKHYRDTEKLDSKDPNLVNIKKDIDFIRTEHSLKSSNQEAQSRNQLELNSYNQRLQTIQQQVEDVNERIDKLNKTKKTQIKPIQIKPIVVDPKCFEPFTSIHTKRELERLEGFLDNVLDDLEDLERNPNDGDRQDTLATSVEEFVERLTERLGFFQDQDDV